MMAFLVVVLESLTVTWRVILTCVHRAPIPVLLYFAGAIVSSLPGYGLRITGAIIVLFSYVNLSVVIHRILLVGSDAISMYRFGNWTWRETYYLLYMIGIGLIAAIVAIPFSMFGDYGILLSLPVSAWVAGRLSPAFPAIAIDRSPKLRIAWNLSVDRQLMMTLVMMFPVFFSLLFDLVSLLLNWLVPYSFYRGSSLLVPILAGISIAISFLLVVIHTIMLTIAYRHLCDEID